MPYTITYGASNAVIAVSQYDVLPSVLATGEYACTLAQFNNPSAWMPSGGALVASPNASAIVLAQSKTAQTALLSQAYDVVIQQPISYMSTTFQADKASQDLMAQTIIGLQSIVAVGGTVPADFGWWDANNVKVPMTLVQLQGLYATGFGIVNTAFANKQAKKSAMRAASTVASVQAITF